jgi:hypothetical protein
MEFKELKVNPVRMVKTDDAVVMVFQVISVSMELQVLLALLVKKVPEVLMVPMDILLSLPTFLVTLVELVFKVCLVHKVLPVLKVHEVQLVLKVTQVPVVDLEYPVKTVKTLLVNLVQLAMLVNLVKISG